MAVATVQTCEDLISLHVMLEISHIVIACKCMSVSKLGVDQTEENDPYHDWAS